MAARRRRAALLLTVGAFGARCVGHAAVPSALRGRPRAVEGRLRIFLDLDDCLYRNGWATAERLTERIESYCSRRLGLPSGKAYELYKTYGTAIHGLRQENLIEEQQIEEYLEYAHDISLEEIRPDPDLRELILAIPHPKWVFTASTAGHARRCLGRLGLDKGDCIHGVISACSAEARERLGLAGKHDPRCFRWAMEVAGVPDSQPERCVLIDDSPRNLQTAKELGWKTVLVGLSARGSGEPVDRTWADSAIGSIHELREAAPELFLE